MCEIQDIGHRRSGDMSRHRRPILRRVSLDMGRFLIEMHLRTGKPIKELARTHEVSPSWLFKLLRRYRRKAPPASSPEAGSPSPRRP